MDGGRVGQSAPKREATQILSLQHELQSIMPKTYDR